MKYSKRQLWDLFAKSGAVMDEVYQWDSKVKKFTEDGPHGEYVTFLGGINDALQETEYECEYWLMDEQEFNNSIMCPFSPHANFAEEYDDKNAKVFVIVIDAEPIQNDTDTTMTRKELENKIYGSVATFNADPFICEDYNTIKAVADSIERDPIRHVADSMQAFNDALAKLDLLDAAAVYENSELTICFAEDMVYYSGYAVAMELDGKHGYVYNEDDIEDGGWVDLPEDGLLSKEEADKLLRQLKGYCDANGYKNISLYIEGVEDDGEVEDVHLTKHNNGSDYLGWTYNGKDYWAQGEFYIDKDNNLHHTFIAPSGKEIEIITPYE